MKTTTIQAVAVDKMRRLAQEAARLPEPIPRDNGWTKSPVDPMKILGAFPRLRLKPGLILRAYVLHDEGDGHGVVWAVPENLPFPEPLSAEVEAAPALPTPYGWPPFLWRPPSIPGCLPDLMAALCGDGSPESYLQASLFAREAGEFGAQWHGCDWSTHRILGNDSWVAPKAEGTFDSLPSLNSWKWLNTLPENWDPTITEDGDTVTVRFATFTEYQLQQLVLHVDTYKPGSYECQHASEQLATGEGGYIF
jgi:hypothetical protein